MQFIASFLLFSVFFSGQNTNFLQNTNQLISNYTQNVADETEHFEQSYPFSSDGKINISNINGSITIEAWDKDEIKFEYTKTASSKERLNDLEVQIDASKNRFEVSTEYKRNNYQWGRAERLDVELRLFVPKNAYLEKIETVNGSVSISKMKNYVRATAVNGNVKGINLSGETRLSTVNGSSEASFDEIENKGLISIETVNGSAVLTIPSDADVTIKADTLNGSINNDFGLYVKKGQYVGKKLYSKLGSGESQIKLESVNGGLAIRRKNDGKQIKTATNLLSTKDDDEVYSSGGYSIATTVPPVNISVPPIAIAPITVPPANITVPPVALAPLNFPNLSATIPAIAGNSEEAREAQEEYKTAITEYQANLKTAQAELAVAQKEYQESVKDYNASIKQAQNELAEARKNASQDQKELQNAQAEYDEAMKEALSNLDECKKDYDQSVKEYNLAINEAQTELKRAQKDYQKAIAEVSKIGSTSSGNGYSYSYSNDFDYSNSSIDKKSDSFAVKGTPKVTIDAPNCDVYVRGWDKQEVAYTITKFSRTQSQKPIEFEVNHTDSEVSIKSLNQGKGSDAVNLNLRDGNNNVTINADKKDAVTVNGVTYRPSNYVVKIEVFVPKKSNLKISTDKEVRLEGVSGDLEILGDDGAINVRDSDGTLKLSNADGRVRVIGFKGELDSRTDDGDVFLEGNFSKINAKAHDGSYTLTISDSTNAEITSNKNSIQYGENAANISKELKIGKGEAKYNFTLQDGKIFLRKSDSLK